MKVAASPVKLAVVSTDKKVLMEEKPNVTLEAATSSWKVHEARKATASLVQASSFPSDDKAAIEENAGFKATREKLYNEVLKMATQSQSSPKFR